jgi:Cys-tRNA synthase (O-phospho-L-seryl-tRNA:Cys-tRNA synthase)
MCVWLYAYAEKNEVDMADKNKLTTVKNGAAVPSVLGSGYVLGQMSGVLQVATQCG